MGRVIVVVLSLVLSGCAALTVVAAIPSALVEGVAGLFQGQVRTLPVDMRTSLVAVQQVLHNTHLDVDVLEPVKDGYAIGFGNKKIDGTLRLTPQTSMLTTMNMKVYQGISRETSVETTLVDEIQRVSAQVSQRQQFDFSGYGIIRTGPDKAAKQLGWYRRRAELKIKATRQQGWLIIKMPNGDTGYLEGDLLSNASK
jgi:uncharacterized transporter YbjL